MSINYIRTVTQEEADELRASVTVHRAHRDYWSCGGDL